MITDYAVAIFIVSKLPPFHTVSGFSGVLRLNLANSNSQGTRQKLRDSAIIVSSKITRRGMGDL